MYRRAAITHRANGRFYLVGMYLRLFLAIGIPDVGNPRSASLRQLVQRDTGMALHGL